MRPRDLMILMLLLALGASVGIVLLANESHAIAAPSGPSTEAEPTEEPPPAPEPSILPALPAVADQDGGTPRGAVFSKSDEVDTTGWRDGIIRGDIQLAVSVLDRIKSMSVIVEELRGPPRPGQEYVPPFKKVIPVERGLGTPTFEIRRIPFSDHPFSVSVYSPGLNGGRRTVTVNAETPLHDDVVLSITPGAPFSILVRDQDANPYAGVDIRILPIGEPPGRQQHIGKTDNYGSVVFESVLAGDYRLVSNQQGIPLAEPVQISVQPGARRYGNKIQGQGYTLLVQRGVPLEIMVSSGGYGVADAKIKLQATDRTRLCLLEAETNYGGNVAFPHLTPGKWMVQVTKQNYQPWTRQLTIVDGQLPPRLEVGLSRLR